MNNSTTEIPSDDDIIDVHDVAVMIGCKNRKTVLRKRSEDPSFPRSVRVAGIGARWVRGDIVAWLRARVQEVRAENAERLAQSARGVSK